METNHDVTQLLQEWSRGCGQALDDLAPLVFDELRRLARCHFVREPQGHTLQPTALVNEFFVRLLGRREVRWANRSQFFKYATQSMRLILVDHARRRNAARRGGSVRKIPLEDSIPIPAPLPDVDTLALYDALEDLGRQDPQRRHLVELKYFLGLTHDEISQLLGVPVDTIKARWAATKARLYRELKKN